MERESGQEHIGCDIFMWEGAIYSGTCQAARRVFEIRGVLFIISACVRSLCLVLELRSFVKKQFIKHLVK
jgi:hypothetical protein